jgi:multidrug efflux pump subunit AcrA (membrane-fusion protein)
MFKKRLLLFALAFAGAVAALQLTRGTATEATIKPPPYEPATRDKDGLIAAAGLIEAVAENTLLGSPTSGTVAKVHVKVWDKVKAGDPILTLDDRDLRAQHAVQTAAVDAAAATAERAVDAARRWTGIKDSGAVSAADLLSYQMAAKEAQAKLALAKAQLDQTSVLLDRLVLRSPIDATVLQVGVRVGEFVAAGAKAPVVLGDITRLQIRCDVDEQLATRMRELPRRRSGPFHRAEVRPYRALRHPEDLAHRRQHRARRHPRPPGDLPVRPPDGPRALRRPADGRLYRRLPRCAG